MFNINRLDFTKREEILTRLKEESKSDNGYFFLIILSVIITTLGLVLNSVAIIIGGMIVSPLLYPIITIGAAIVTGNSNLIKKSLLLTFRSLIVAVGGSFLITLVSPLRDLTSEILSRTEPTLIDLIVALATGAAGAYAVTVKQRVASITGVAVSAAIVPPLSIVGFSLATGSYDLVWGSLLLFIANLIAVIMATIVVFYMLGFRPGRKEEKKTEAKRDFGISFALFLGVLVVLTIFLRQTIVDSSNLAVVEDEIKLFLKNYSNTTLISLGRKEIPDQLLITATIQSPSQFTQRAVNILDQRLERRLDHDVNLQIFIIPVTKIIDQTDSI